jgi:hypothetical protein
MGTGPPRSGGVAPPDAIAPAHALMRRRVHGPATDHAEIGVAHFFGAGGMAVQPRIAAVAPHRPSRGPARVLVGRRGGMSDQAQLSSASLDFEGRPAYVPVDWVAGNAKID